MLFSSYSFLILFLPLLVIVYYIIPDRFRNYLLLLASLGFYAWGGPKYLLVMLFSIFINYVWGLLIEKYDSNAAGRRLILFGTVVSNLALLGYFKYTDFFIENVNAVFHTDIALKHIVLPIGISFYTFQCMSYVFDVGRKKGSALKNPLDLALYISMFPQLIAGPIVRYETIASQIKSRTVTVDDMDNGIFRFVIGLSKKVLLANTIGELASYCFTLNIENIDMVTAWMGAVAYCLQLYFDFSGYSDMAIGLGRIFGFTFPENFNYPFASTSFTDFWRRWHISLSTWFRDYVYIPLGGSRKGIFRYCINIFIVWTLTGLWHGAAWNFVAWGVYSAIFLLVEKYVGGYIGRVIKFKIPGLIQRIYALLTIGIGITIFNSPSVGFAFDFVKTMFKVNTFNALEWDKLVYYMHQYGVVLVVGCLAASPVGARFAAKISGKLNATWNLIIRLALIVILFAVCLMRIVVSSYNPFIYFRF